MPLCRDHGLAQRLTRREPHALWQPSIRLARYSSRWSNPPASRRSLAHSTTSPSLCRDVRTATPRLFTPTVPRRALASPAATPTPDLAILGGGITGLATAYYAATTLPEATVTLYERESRAGGWIKTRRAETDEGFVYFEGGPRSLRVNTTNAQLMLRLNEELGLVDEILPTLATSPAARNRFIYYPDHLVRMPGPGMSIWTVLMTMLKEPVFEGVAMEGIKGLWAEVTQRPQPWDPRDRSLGEFISQSFGTTVADNLASALMHGIYAGDIWQLSAKSIMPQLWENARKYDTLSNAMLTNALEKTSWEFCDDIEMKDTLVGQGKWSPPMVEKIKGCSIYTYKHGMQTLSDRLVEKLQSMPNVRVKLGAEVENIKQSDDETLVLTGCKTDTPAGHDSQIEARHTHLVSTLSPASVGAMTKSQQGETPQLYTNATQAPSVGVVNFHWNDSDLLRNTTLPGGHPAGVDGPLAGFGYLIPQTIPLEQNPERALGVIFDSDASPDLHTTRPAERRGTRLTVMLGGHWWDGWKDVPCDTQLVDLARSVLQRHLGITQAPDAQLTWLHSNAIPQYTVGHAQRMKELHRALLDGYKGRVKLAGAWYTGVGVNDCVRAAYDVVLGMRTADADSRTGLERFDRGRPLAKVKKLPGAWEVICIEEAAAQQGYFKGVRIEGHE